MDQGRYQRFSRSLVLDGMNDTRVVFIAGARQVGKTTLAKDIAERDHPMHSISLDDEGSLAAARSDPVGFIAGAPTPVLIDEIQRAPKLLLAIKSVVDRDDTPGQFLLTGSANIRTLKSVRDALTGRIDTVPLWPLSQAEIHGVKANIVDSLISASPPWVENAPIGREAFADIAAAGGFPEALRRDGARRRRWFKNYVETTLDSDLRELSDAIKLDAIPGLLRLLASQSANLLSYTAAGADIGLHHATVKAYTGLLEQIYIVRRLPGWRPGLGAREASTPKLYLTDSGLLASQLGADADRIRSDDQVTGKVLETFVVTETLKHLEWSQHDVRAYHLQDNSGDIDLLLEAADGSVAALEVKAAATVSNRDTHRMRKLRDSLGDRFRAGYVICTRAETAPMGDRLWAVPVSGLWSAHTKPDPPASR